MITFSIFLFYVFLLKKLTNLSPKSQNPYISDLVILQCALLSFYRKTECSEADTQTSPEHKPLCRTAPPLPELTNLPEEDRHALQYLFAPFFQRLKFSLFGIQLLLGTQHFTSRAFQALMLKKLGSLRVRVIYQLICIDQT